MVSFEVLLTENILNPQSELLLLIGTIGFTFLFFSSIVGKRGFKAIMAYFLALVSGCLTAKGVIVNYSTNDAQIWISIIYLSITIICVLRFLISSRQF